MVANPVEKLDVINRRIEQLSVRRQSHSSWGGISARIAGRDFTGIHKELDDLYDAKRACIAEIEQRSKQIGAHSWRMFPQVWATATERR